MPHTPGPWFVLPNGRCVGGPTGFIDGDPREKTAGVALCGMKLRTEEEAEANAHLIAAAPDLLAACEELLSIWPLSGYELEAFCAATLIPTMEKAVAKAKEPN